MKATSYAWIESEDKLPSWRERELDVINEGRHGSVTIKDDDEHVFLLVSEEPPRIGHSGGLEVSLAARMEGEDPLNLVTATLVRRRGEETEIKLNFWGNKTPDITVVFDPDRRRSGSPEDIAGPKIYYGYQLVETGE
jgi:hypothetical protein